MTLWDVPLADSLTMDLYHREIKRAAGKAYDLAYDDPDEALHMIDCIAAYASEWRVLVMRRAVDRQNRIEREEAETAIPPLGS